MKGMSKTPDRNEGPAVGGVKRRDPAATDEGEEPLGAGEPRDHAGHPSRRGRGRVHLKSDLEYDLRRARV